jgi:protein ImuB
VTSRDARPRVFTFRNKRYAVEHAYGPWLGSGDWWNATQWVMEQWDIIARSQDGAALLLSRPRAFPQSLAGGGSL